MPTTEGTASERVSVPAILAGLIMLGQLHKLPDPYHMGATEANGIASIDVRSRVAFDGWMAALGCNTDGYISDQPFQGGRLASAPSVTRLGWHINLLAQYSEVHTELPAETLTVLEQVANPAREIAIVSEERAEEILTELNGFIDHEYEGGTEIRLGVAVPVRTVVGSDFNLDKAIDWAATQPDVLEAELVCDGPPEIKLIDGTLIVWEQYFKCWCIVAPVGPAS